MSSLSTVRVPSRSPTTNASFHDTPISRASGMKTTPKIR